jgi:hypothetical protein
LLATVQARLLSRTAANSGIAGVRSRLNPPTIFCKKIWEQGGGYIDIAN